MEEEECYLELVLSQLFLESCSFFAHFASSNGNGTLSAV